MRNFLLAFVLSFAASVALAADYRIDTVSVSTQSASSTTFTCGGQIALRPMSVDGGTAPDVSYVVCDSQDYTVGADGGVCVATINDSRLSANTTYDITVPAPSSSTAVCRVAAITQTGSGVLQVYRVNPRTLPSNLQ